MTLVFNLSLACRTSVPLTVIMLLKAVSPITKAQRMTTSVKYIQTARSSCTLSLLNLFKSSIVIGTENGNDQADNFVALTGNLSEQWEIRVSQL